MTSISNSSDFYVLGGTLPRDARSYAVRKADEDLLDGLRKGQFCYVLTSRQMGKSSLMVRTVTRLRQENVTCLVIDLTATGQNLTEDQWYDGLLNCIAADLDLEDELDEFWQSNQRLGPLQRWMHALRSVVLTHISGPIVIFVDEVDAVRSLPFSADEFFAGVRECYNRRTEDPEFNRLTFCLLGVASPADLIRDTRSTPFNIGKRIALTDFTEAEAAPLAEGLAAQREGESGRAGEGEKVLLNRVLYWTHGHPYLTQRLCSAVSDSLSAPTPDLVDKICNDIFLAPGAQAQDDNLLFVRERLLRADCDPTSLLLLYEKVRSGKRVQNSETDYQISILRLSGIVRVENGVLCVRNRIYAHVFDWAWVRKSIPDEDLRRQKSAFRKGVLGTGLAAAALLLLFVAGFMLTHYQKHLNMHVPLPDGTELIVNDVSFGKDKTYEPGTFRWRALFGRSPDKITFREPTLSLWLSIYNPKTHKTEALNSGSQVRAVDEHGDLFENTYMGGEMYDGGRVVRFDFSNFPRRSRTIHLRLQRAYAAGDPKLSLGMPDPEFDISNPVPNLYPLWTPDPLPTSKTVGDLTIRLNSVRWSAPLGGPINPWHEHQLQPDYSCRESGQSAWPKHNPCQIEWMELSDATGNRDEGWAVFAGGNLSIYEPAWRLRMSLIKSADSSFTSSQTWTLKGAMMPKDGSVVLPKGTGKVGGITLTSISIAAAPRVTYTDSVPPSASGTLGKTWGHGLSTSVKYLKIPRQAAVFSGCRPQIAVTVSGMRDDQRLTLWATDGGGRRYNQVGERMLNWYNNQQSPPVQVQLLPIPQAVRGVDLHFSVQDIKTVEFMVRPPLPGAESKSR